jgi:hypothetical protein
VRAGHPSRGRARLRRAGVPADGRSQERLFVRHGKAHGRRSAGSGRPRPGTRALKRCETQESIGLRSRLTPWTRDTDSTEVPDLEGEHADSTEVEAVAPSAASAGYVPRRGRSEAPDGAASQRQEGCGHREMLRLRVEGKALQGETP